jgi:hypothetical protein
MKMFCYLIWPLCLWSICAVGFGMVWWLYMAGVAVIIVFGLAKVREPFWW